MMKVKNMDSDVLYDGLIEIKAEDNESLYQPAPPTGFESQCSISSKESPFIYVDPELRENILLVQQWKNEDKLFTETFEAKEPKKKKK